MLVTSYYSPNSCNNGGGTLSRIYESTIVKWAARVYLAWKWTFANPEDICAGLTGSPASFWEKHPEECQDRIARDFTATLVLFEVALMLGTALVLGCRYARR